ncbi:hypothetical protein HanIR_Chr07g0325401 [Helianthus annuus]|nr:hypothetical protein HanIR_Chr07g0325401 [Helianthus annuus]
MLCLFVCFVLLSLSLLCLSVFDMEMPMLYLKKKKKNHLGSTCGVDLSVGEGCIAKLLSLVGEKTSVDSPGVGDPPPHPHPPKT